jgi:hypothetical protein
MKKYTEASFTNQVIQLAQLHGWRVAHFRPARTAKGWRTAVSGDGKGFPDLVMLRNDEMIVAELKMPKGRLTPEQEAWMNQFDLISYCAERRWTPDDWPEIERMLNPK